MLIRDRKFEIVRATPADSADIRRLFENIRYDAAIDLQFRRGNDPYRSFQEEDDGAVVLLLKETSTGRTVGMGAASFHRVYLGGEVRRSAYLNGLKLLPEYRMRLRVLPEAFSRLLEETQGESDICYAAVLQQNTPVQRMFEKPHRTVPCRDLKSRGCIPRFCSPRAERAGCRWKRAVRRGWTHFTPAGCQSTTLHP